MGIANCPTCNALFNKTTFRLVCDACFREEEAQFEKVYQFIRKRVNRTATMAQVVEATEVDEDLIIRYVKSGKLRLAQFPNLGSPASNAGSQLMKEDYVKNAPKILVRNFKRLIKKKNAGWK